MGEKRYLLPGFTSIRETKCWISACKTLRTSLQMILSKFQDVRKIEFRGYEWPVADERYLLSMLHSIQGNHNILVEIHNSSQDQSSYDIDASWQKKCITSFVLLINQREVWWILESSGLLHKRQYALVEIQSRSPSQVQRQCMPEKKSFELFSIEEPVLDWRFVLDWKMLDWKMCVRLKNLCWNEGFMLHWKTYARLKNLCSIEDSEFVLDGKTRARLGTCARLKSLCLIEEFVALSVWAFDLFHGYFFLLQFYSYNTSLWHQKPFSKWNR